MKERVFILLICFFAVSINAQNVTLQAGSQKTPKQSRTTDPLITHLKAAENYQASRDLANATIENRAVLSIALQRFGNILIEEGKYLDAVHILNESLKFDNNATVRTNLAVAYLRQKNFDKALIEAQRAIAINPNHIGAHYILGNIYYTRENYKVALPNLEFVFEKAPDFEIARALGLTYLNLKKIELARKHFEKMRVSAGKPNADLHILFAKLYELTDFPSDAEKELTKALAIEPQKSRLNFYLGYLLLENGGSERLGEAGAAFERELLNNPNDFSSLFFAGVAASAENKHEEAIPFLRRAKEVNPKSGEAHLFLGQSQIELGNLADAEKNLRIAVALESNGGKNTQSRRTHYMLGRLLLKTGKKEEAKKELAIAKKLQQKSLQSSRNEIDRILNQVVEKNEPKPADVKSIGSNVNINLPPKRLEQLKKMKAFLTDIIAQTYNNMGVIEIQGNRLSESIDNFSAAYQWKPDFPNLSRNLGIISFRAEEFENAIAPLSRHLEANPQDILIRKMLGSSYYLTKDFAKSVETLKPIETGLTNDAELAYFYGISLIRLKQDQKAVPIFNQLAKMSQTNPEALFYAAQGFMILSDYNRATKEFGQVLSLAPNTPKANYFIGQSFIRLNRLADAEKAFARELEINPNDAVSKYHLALTLIERKIETKRAIKTLEEAISLRNDYADAHYQLGKIYLERGEVKKAIEQLEKGVSADAKKDYIHYQLSIAYRKDSRKEDAKRELELYKKLKKAKRKNETPMPMGGDEIPIPAGSN